MDRASDYGSEGWGFDSLRAHHQIANRDKVVSGLRVLPFATKPDLESHWASHQRADERNITRFALENSHLNWAKIYSKIRVLIRIQSYNLVFCLPSKSDDGCGDCIEVALRVRGCLRLAGKGQFGPFTSRVIRMVERKLLSVSETLESLAISRATLYRLMHQGRIIPVKIGRCTRFTPAAIDRLVKNLEECSREVVR